MILGMLLRLGLASLMTSVLGCATPQEAPTEIVDLSLFFFEEFDTADEALFGDAFINLEEAIAQNADLDGERADRQWELATLLPEHLGGATAPEGEDPENQVTMGLARRSAYRPADHVGIILLPDQAPVDPSAPQYDRTFLVGEDCFAGRDCERLESSNSVTKSNLLLEVSYTAPKHWRHVTLPDGRAAVAGRTWNPEKSIGEQGQNSIDQTYSVDLLFEDPEDPSASIRYFTLWSAVTLSIEADERLIRGTMALGAESLLSRHDSYLDDEGR